MIEPSGKKKKDPRRIGYLLRMYPRHSQTFVANEICELERQGVDVRILSLKKPDDGVFHEACCRVKAKAEYLPETPYKRSRRMMRAHGKWFRRSPKKYFEAARVIRSDAQCGWFDLYRAMELLRWVKTNRIGHVHVHFGTSEATVAMVASLLGRLSYSLTLHAFDIFRNTVDRSLLAQKINRSRFTVTVSEFNRRYMVDNLPGVDTNKINVNYNGIELARFAARERRSEVATIFGLGRLIEKKGFVHLVRAVRILRDQGIRVRCWIGGSGPESKRLSEEIEQLQVQDDVELLGSLNEEQVHDYMGRAACFVLPCVQAKDANVDALPTVLLEALAAGCPVITTRLSGNPEIVDDDVSGLLVDPGDEVQLADAIRKVVLNRDFATTLADAGRRRARDRFDIRRNVSVMRNWFMEHRDDSGSQHRAESSLSIRETTSVAPVCREAV